MARRIVVLNVDGTERVLDQVPKLAEMQAIVGGFIEHVRVLDHIEPSGRFVYTSMFVNEDGLRKELPRNVKATAVYQSNVRSAFPDAPNPFKAADDYWRARMPANVVVEGWTPASAIAAGYNDDPWIAGPAILFEGWTVAEVNAAS